MVELTLVIVILGILGSLAVPRYGRFLARQKAESATRRIVADLAFAQRQAKFSSTAQTVSFNVTTDSYSLVGLADPDHAGGDYIVSLAREPYRTTIVSVDLGGDADIIFNGYGLPDSGGWITVAVGRSQLTVIVDAQTGRATVVPGVIVADPPPNDPIEQQL